MNLILKIKSKRVELSVEEARALFTELGSIFNVPLPPVIYPMPVLPYPQPENPFTPPWEITCGHCNALN